VICDLGSCPTNAAPAPAPPQSVKPYTWGRTYDVNGNPTWVRVTQDANGFNDYVYLSALIQCAKLNLNESPFWSNFGIPAHQSIAQQLPPDYNVQFIAQYFMQFFPSVIVTRVPPSASADTPQQNVGPYGKAIPGFPRPQYYWQILRNNGSIWAAKIGT